MIQKLRIVKVEKETEMKKEELNQNDDEAIKQTFFNNIKTCVKDGYWIKSGWFTYLVSDMLIIELTSKAENFFFHNKLTINNRKYHIFYPIKKNIFDRTTYSHYNQYVEKNPKSYIDAWEDMADQSCFQIKSGDKILLKLESRGADDAFMDEKTFSLLANTSLGGFDVKLGLREKTLIYFKNYLYRGVASVLEGSPY